MQIAFSIAAVTRSSLNHESRVRTRVRTRKFFRIFSGFFWVYWHSQLKRALCNAKNAEPSDFYDDFPFHTGESEERSGGTWASISLHDVAPATDRGVEPTVKGTWFVLVSEPSARGSGIASIILKHARCCRASLNNYEAHAAQHTLTTPTLQYTNTVYSGATMSTRTSSIWCHRFLSTSALCGRCPKMRYTKTLYYYYY